MYLAVLWTADLPSHALTLIVPGSQAPHSHNSSILTTGCVEHCLKSAWKCISVPESAYQNIQLVSERSMKCSSEIQTAVMLIACTQNSRGSASLHSVLPQTKGIKTTFPISLKNCLKGVAREKFSFFYQKWISVQPRMQFIGPEEKKFGQLLVFASLLSFTSFPGNSFAGNNDDLQGRWKFA